MKPKNEDILKVLSPEKELRVKAHIVIERLQKEGFDWNNGKISSEAGKVKSFARRLSDMERVGFITPPKGGKEYYRRDW